MAIQLENVTQDDSYFQNALPQYYRDVLQKFGKISRSIVHVKWGFGLLLAVECACFGVFFSSFSGSTLLALFLGVLLLTGCVYYVLSLYFHTRKPELLVSLKDEFVASCRRILSSSEGTVEQHLSIAEALFRLAQYLRDYEWEFYGSSRLFKPLLSRFSAYSYWEDVFIFKESLLFAAIEEHIVQIRMTPTDLEVHASLAGTYVALSKLYRDLAEKERPSYEGKSEKYSRLAMEEFKILNHYAANDPWVHEQMATGYKDLSLPAEETREVEILLKLRPMDKEILFRLGSLYFAQGLNAKGLEVYEELKRTHFKKAEDLIASYGAL